MKEAYPDINVDKVPHAKDLHKTTKKEYWETVGERLILLVPRTESVRLNSSRKNCFYTGWGGLCLDGKTNI